MLDCDTAVLSTCECECGLLKAHACCTPEPTQGENESKPDVVPHTLDDALQAVGDTTDELLKKHRAGVLTRLNCAFMWGIASC